MQTNYSLFAKTNLIVFFTGYVHFLSLVMNKKTGESIKLSPQTEDKPALVLSTRPVLFLF